MATLQAAFQLVVGIQIDLPARDGVSFGHGGIGQAGLAGAVFGLIVICAFLLHIGTRSVK